MEQRLEEGVALLADFFAQCLELLATAGKPDSILAVVTMRKEWHLGRRHPRSL